MNSRVASLLSAVALGLVACTDSATGQSGTPATGRPGDPLATAPSENLVLRGNALFFEQGCHGCHTLGAAGTRIAPDLTHIGSRLSEADLALRLRDPRLHREVARMPKIDLSPDEIRALVAYLSALR